MAPSIVTIRKIADAFGCSASDLVAEAEEREASILSERAQGNARLSP